MERPKITRLFITVSNKASASHPLMLVVETDAPADRFKRSAQAKWEAIYGVSVTDVNAAYSYANGVNHGLNHAGLNSAPIVIDSRLGLIDHYAAATAREN